MKKAILLTGAIAICSYGAYRLINSSSWNPNKRYAIGQPLDSLNGVTVHYNGMVGHTAARNLSADGYNIGMRYQCVEFVKRYYYQRWGHKMPDSYGNAKDFFDRSLPDSAWNAKRGLVQMANGSRWKPKPEDLLIFDGHAGNKYGHVAIVASVNDSAISIIQQNPGPFAASRDTFSLTATAGKWLIGHPRAIGWLRRDTLAALH